jgi:hypothetical protein
MTTIVARLLGGISRLLLARHGDILRCGVSEIGGHYLEINDWMSFECRYRLDLHACWRAGRYRVKVLHILA